MSEDESTQEVPDNDDEKEYEMCDWVDLGTFSEEAKKVLQQFNMAVFETNIRCGFDKETQEFYFDTIRCVPLELIKEHAVWSPGRLERIREWGNKWSLTSMDYDPSRHFRVYGLPILSREQDIDKAHEDKGIYEITDGIHRTALARELGMSCILAEAQELIRYTKAHQEEARKKQREEEE